MHIIEMPKAGQTMEEGTIVSWLKSEGDAVSKGEPLVEIETDKAVFEFESDASGLLLKILQPAGALVPVHTPIALLGAQTEDVDSFLSTLTATAASPAAPAPPAESSAAPRGAAGSAKPLPPSAPIVSPAARKAAREMGVDLTALTGGSGPGGRITYDDVLKAAQAVAPAAPSTVESEGGVVRRPMTKMRRAIASTLQSSKQSIPHFYTRLTIDAEPLLSFHESAKATCSCTLNDIILLACARAAMEFPQVRSRIDGSDVLEFPSANIGIAVAIDDGLIVPVLVSADRMSLAQLAPESKRLISSARAGKLEGVGKGLITVTNLGMFGVDDFAAIINPPESAILAVGAIRQQPVVRHGAVTPGRVMTLTLSADHRLIDGVVAAKFLGRIKALLENPSQFA